MIEKVNPSHPDKIADRIAGALVDYCYTKEQDPKCAFEVLIGHGRVYIIGETSVHIEKSTISNVVKRISGIDLHIEYLETPQDIELNKNQARSVKAGDNGIFKGVPIKEEIVTMSNIARVLYKQFPTDGKYILDGNRVIICQSNASNNEIVAFTPCDYELTINPLGYWTGGIDVDTGAVNRKLGSDMGEAVTGGGLHGKDLSKADISVNIYAHLKAQETSNIVDITCAIGDETVDGKPYRQIVEIARKYVKNMGGFEKLAEWGLV